MNPRCTDAGSTAAVRPPLAMRTRLLIGTALSFGILGGVVLVPSSPGAPADRPVQLAAESIPVLDAGPSPAVATSPAPAGQAAGATAGASPVDAAYQRAARACPGLDPAVLAAIHTIESHRGTDRRASSAGALGPMQFLPGTWAHYRTDGNGDGRADIHNLSDSLSTAAHYLCANGAADPGKLPTAVWHYNHSRSYVSSVLRLADRLNRERSPAA